MTKSNSPKQEKIDKYFELNLKKVFSDYQENEMPNEVLDLLAVLRAQDEEMKDEK
ncbi:hypothetical protein AB3Y40_12095 [Yoonia sp. R2331]|uniref:hypothetical protein n=1 Tax=Yoonia sp. R2331 TaxID=3237238 RepID=UPI0034E4D287